MSRSLCVALLLCPAVALGCRDRGPLEAPDPLEAGVVDDRGKLLAATTSDFAELVWSRDGDELFFMQWRHEGPCQSDLVRLLKGIRLSDGVQRELYQYPHESVLTAIGDHLQRPPPSDRLYLIATARTGTEPCAGFAYRTIVRVDPGHSDQWELAFTPAAPWTGFVVSRDERFIATGPDLSYLKLGPQRGQLFDRDNGAYQYLPTETAPLSFSPDGAVLLHTSLTEVTSTATGHPLAEFSGVPPTCFTTPANPPVSCKVLRRTSEFRTLPVHWWEGSVPFAVIAENAELNGGGARRVSVVNLQTGTTRSVAVVPGLTVAPDEEHIESGAVSPDGRKVAIWVRVRGPAGTSERARPHQLHIVDVPGATARLVATVANLSADALSWPIITEFSPDGTKLAYVLHRTPPLPSLEYHIHLVEGL